MKGMRNAFFNFFFFFLIYNDRKKILSWWFLVLLSRLPLFPWKDINFSFDLFFRLHKMSCVMIDWLLLCWTSLLSCCCRSYTFKLKTFFPSQFLPVSLFAFFLVRCRWIYYTFPSQKNGFLSNILQAFDQIPQRHPPCH